MASNSPLATRHSQLATRNRLWILSTLSSHLSQQAGIILFNGVEIQLGKPLLVIAANYVRRLLKRSLRAWQMGRWADAYVCDILIKLKALALLLNLLLSVAHEHKMGGATGSGTACRKVLPALWVPGANRRQAHPLPRGARHVVLAQIKASKEIEK